MKRFLSVDDLGFVYGYSAGLEPPGPGWVEIEFDASQAVTAMTRFRMVDGELIDTGITKLPPMPYMQWVNGNWTDPRDLDAVKADKWAEMKARRDQEEHGGFYWDGSLFDSDLASQSKIIGAVQLANLHQSSFSIDWTLADNTVRTLDAADMNAVGVAMAQHVNAQHVTARAVRQAIEAAATIEEVQAIAWPEPPN
jgi:hypothetical protein